jgi:hypothetical protein
MVKTLIYTNLKSKKPLPSTKDSSRACIFKVILPPLLPLIEKVLKARTG